MKRLGSLMDRYSHAFLIMAGLAVIVYGLFYYTNPMTRLKINGVRLQHPEFAGQPLLYLIGTHCEVKSWAYRDGSMDTPLLSSQQDETGTVAVELDPSPRASHSWHVKANEWVKMAQSGEATVNQMIPLNHPSLAPGTIIFDSQGTLLERQNASSIRIGRAMNFIFPQFPKGTKRPGDTWTEQITWYEMIGEWEIRWDADLAWKLKDFESCYETTCAGLISQGTLHPSLAHAPYWAQKAATGVAFAGQASGEVLYQTRDKLLISHTFTYNGRLTVQISSLESIPEEQRVGTTLTSDPGEVVLQFTSKVDIRKPN